MKKRDALLIDTDILIDYLRGFQAAVHFLESLENDLIISTINVAEVYSGIRDHERDLVKNFLDCFEIVPLDEAIALEGGLLRRNYGKSHGVGLADAIVAATAIKMGCQLATLNLKHYPMLKTVSVPYQKK
jgi:predicted nucleic acid-binding protein